MDGWIDGWVDSAHGSMAGEDEGDLPVIACLSSVPQPGEFKNTPAPSFNSETILVSHSGFISFK